MEPSSIVVKSVATELENLRARHFERVASSGSAFNGAASAGREADSEELFVGKLTLRVLRGLAREFCPGEVEGAPGPNNTKRGGASSASTTSNATSHGKPDMALAFASLGINTPPDLGAPKSASVTLQSPQSQAVGGRAGGPYRSKAVGQGRGLGLISHDVPSLSASSSSSTSAAVMIVDEAFLGSLSANAHEKLHPARREYLRDSSKAILRAWFGTHLSHPYPTEQEKEVLARKADTTLEKVSNFFINARARDWGRLSAKGSRSMKAEAAGGSLASPGGQANGHNSRKRGREASLADPASSRAQDHVLGFSLEIASSSSSLSLMGGDSERHGADREGEIPSRKKVARMAER